jgi:hypothetical protein
MWQSMKKAIVNWAKVIAFNTAAYFVDKWDKIMSAAKQLWDYLKMIFKNIAATTKELGKNLAETLNPRNWGKFISGEMSVKDVWAGTFDEMRKIGEQAVIEFEEGLSDRAQKLADKATKAIGPAMEATGETVRKQIENWQVSLESVEDWAVKLKDKFKNFFGAGGDAFRGIQQFIQQIRNLKGEMQGVGTEIDKMAAATAYERMRGGRGPATGIFGGGSGYGGFGPGKHPRATGSTFQQAQWKAFVQKILIPVGNAFKKVGGAGKKVFSAFSSVWSIANRLLGQFKIWNRFTEALTKAFIEGFRPAVEALVQALQPLIPIVKVIARIAGKILVPVLRVIGEAFRFVANLFITIANFFIDIAQAFGADVENIDLIERDESYMDESGAGTAGDTSSTGGYETSGAGTGGGSRPRKVNVTVNIYDNELAGSDGFEELARIIRQQFERLETVNG